MNKFEQKERRKHKADINLEKALIKFRKHNTLLATKLAIAQYKEKQR